MRHPHFNHLVYIGYFYVINSDQSADRVEYLPNLQQQLTDFQNW